MFSLILFRIHNKHFTDLEIEEQTGEHFAF